MTGEMRGQLFQRLEHVAVAQVPRRDALAEHHAVVLFRIFRDAGVLLGVKVLVFRMRDAEANVLLALLTKVHQGLHRLIPAGLDQAQPDRVAVVGRVGDLVEAAVVFPGPLRGGRIDLLQIRDHRFEG
jgi:hypothetical protein